MLILLGCCHEVQPFRRKPGYEDQQSKYRKLLSSLIEDYVLKAVAEEGSQRECTIAQAIACERECIYQNLDIDLDTQNRIEKVSDLETLDEESQTLKPHPDYPYARAWALVREYHMFKKYLAFNPNGVPAVLVCGKLHLAGFQNLFSNFPDLRALCLRGSRDACCDRWDDAKLYDF